MCGRFQFAPKGKAIGVDEFGLPEDLHFPERVNLAPTQDVPVVLAENHEFRFQSMRWGLVPKWSHHSEKSASFINARIESASSKLSFREPWKERRCLVLATGYYEWTKRAGAPTLIQPEPEGMFCFAGLWEPNLEHPRSGKPSCTILTYEAALEVREIHHRMPVMLRPDQYESWLEESDPGFGLGSKPQLPFGLQFRPVSKRLNRVGNDDPSLLIADPVLPPNPGLFD